MMAFLGVGVADENRQPCSMLEPCMSWARPIGYAVGCGTPGRLASSRGESANQVYAGLLYMSSKHTLDT